MPESNFDIDRLGMLTLEHFEHGVHSDSSCGENNSCHSELSSSNAYSPPYFTDESESPVSSPTEIKHSMKFWEQNDDQMVGLETDDDVEDNWQKRSTCRYRRGRRGKETVSKRNERERRRVRLISEGFCELRKHLMIKPCNRKLPKLQILRRAILYIKNLEEMIRENDLQNVSAQNRHCSRPATVTASEIPVPYLYETSYISKQAHNMQIAYADTPVLHDIKHRESQPWLQGYQL